MKINKVLDEVFSARSNISVLRVLQNSVNGLTGREAARAAGLTPKACISTLTVLENLGIVKRVRGGRDHIFSLNREHFIVNNIILPVLNEEADYKKMIIKDIGKKLQRISLAVYLFGSVARKDDSVDSDFDICIVFKSDDEKDNLELAISELRNELYIKYGVNISPIYYTEKNFLNNYRSNKSPIPEIIRDAVLISGMPLRKLLNGKTIAKNNSRQSESFGL